MLLQGSQPLLEPPHQPAVAAVAQAALLPTVPSTPSTPCVSTRWATGGVAWWTFSPVLTGCDASAANDDDDGFDCVADVDVDAPRVPPLSVQPLPL